MKIEVPVYNEDGSVKFTASLNEGELQAVLQFGLNAAIGSGLAQHLGVCLVDSDLEPPPYNEQN